MRFGYETPMSLPLTSQLLPPDSPTSIGRRRPSFRLPNALSSNLFPKISLLFLASIVAFFMAYFPSPPKFDLVGAEFRLHTLTGSQISGDWNVTFAVSNPSGGNYYSFKNVAVAVFPAGRGRRDRLAESHIANPDPSESGEPVNRIQVQASLLSPAQYLNDGVLMRFLLDRSDGFIRFDLEISIDSFFKSVLIGPFVSYRKAVCSGVRFEFDGDAEGNFGIAKIEPETCSFSFWNMRRL